ncbi:MAG: hypothetical protein ACPLHI_08140 [Pseudothermotoga sp.]
MPKFRWEFVVESKYNRKQHKGDFAKRTVADLLSVLVDRRS